MTNEDGEMTKEMIKPRLVDDADQARQGQVPGPDASVTSRSNIFSVQRQIRYHILRDEGARRLRLGEDLSFGQAVKGAGQKARP